MEEVVTSFCDTTGDSCATMSDLELLTCVGTFLCLQALSRGISVEELLTHVGDVVNAGFPTIQPQTLH